MPRRSVRSQPENRRGALLTPALEDARDVQGLEDAPYAQPHDELDSQPLRTERQRRAGNLPRGGGCVPFSVCDNPDIASRPTYESTLNKISDHATKDRLPYDNWDFVEVNDTAVYNRFDGALHLVTGLRARAYDPSRPPITLVALLPFVSVHIQKKARPEAAPIQP